jgi:hypothetical protein
LKTKTAQDFSCAVGFDRFENVSVAAAAGAARTAAVQIFRRGDTAQFNRLANLFLNEVLKFVHLLLRVKKAGSNRVFQQRIAFLLEGGDFSRFQRLAAVLFFLERLALAHQAFIRAARAGVGEESVNAFLDAAGFNMLKDGFAQFAGFGFNLVGHKIIFLRRPINHIHQLNANVNAAADFVCRRSMA